MHGQLVHIKVDQTPYFVENSDGCAMKYDTFRKWVVLPHVLSCQMYIIWGSTLNAEDLKYYVLSLYFRDITYLN